MIRSNETSSLVVSKAWRRTATALVVSALFAACGGAADQDVFQGGITTGDSGFSGDDGSTATDDGGGTTNDGSSGTDGGGGQDAGNKTDGGGKKDAGSSDTGADSNPPGATIHCGQGTDCTVGAQVCCREPVGPTYSCMPSSGCTAVGDVPVPCDEASDCTALGHAGDVCCATFGLGGKVNSVECASTGNCNGKGKLIVCNPADTDPCPNGGTCSAGPFGGYFACQ